MKNEIYIRLIITGSKKEITQIVNILEADKVWNKNDLKLDKGTIKHKKNGCEFNIKKDNLFHLEEIFDDFILKILPLKSFLSQNNNVEKILNITIYSYKIMPSICYSRASLNFINFIGVELEHDIYCMKKSEK